ncbi:hypothetical protein MJD09_23085 [bacterium]|nr:hypothetical protein [bacterium]
MLARIRIYLAIIVLLVLHILAVALGKEPDTPSSFETATVHFEQNATDGDVEVVFEVIGGDKGLAQLTILAPDGRTVVDFKAPDPSTMGIRSFRFESPEPTDIEGLKAAYPEGAYHFTGATSDGHQFNGESTLNHRLPEIASFVQPEPKAEAVNVEALELK